MTHISWREENFTPAITPMKAHQSMSCPACTKPHSRVVNKRNQPTTIIRRRECMTCLCRWTTQENLLGGIKRRK
jgi:hypothetical protein